MKLLDYECVTTFWDDFTIADIFGEKAIRDTFKRAFREWKENTVYLTELVMVLNHKIWQHNESNEEREIRIAWLYENLWGTAARYAETHLKGDDLTYYLTTVD